MTCTYTLRREIVQVDLRGARERDLGFFAFALGLVFSFTLLVLLAFAFPLGILSAFAAVVFAFAAIIVLALALVVVRLTLLVLALAAVPVGRSSAYRLPVSASAGPWLLLSVCCFPALGALISVGMAPKGQVTLVHPLIIIF